MISYSLNKQVSMEKIVNDISRMVSKESDLNNKILVITIQEVRDYAGDNPLPKIEYKEQEDSLT